jgi:hypothetical protein
VTAVLAAAQAYSELEPLVRRIVGLDPGAVVRIRHRPGRLTVLVRTPFQVLAARSVHSELVSTADVTVGAQALLGWLDDPTAPEPERRDADWRWAVPPEDSWQHIDEIPDDVIRGLVRSGALTLKEAADREGVPGAQPRAEVADALLDSVVLTVTEAGHSAELTLRTVSALTRLGFLARGSAARVDVSRRWVRVAGAYGSVFAETAPLGLLRL